MRGDQMHRVSLLLAGWLLLARDLLRPPDQHPHEITG